MRTAGIALVLFALAGVHRAELLNSDFEDLKRRLVGPPSREGYGATSTWSFTENGQSYDATFEAVAHGHAILERNSGFIASPFCALLWEQLEQLADRKSREPKWTISL
jgi:hypothetical protein